MSAEDVENTAYIKCPGYDDKPSGGGAPVLCFGEC